MKHIAWCLAFAVGLAAARPLAAETYHWTGAEDGFWTNANNWAEGKVPGRYETSAGRMGAAGDTAVFGDALEGKAATTIDFDGVYSILQILTEGTHRYVYGTAEKQYVPIEPFGVFSAAETAATPAAALQARLRLGVELMTTNYGGETMTVRNNAVDEFVLGKWGYGTRAANHGSGGEPGARFEGAGPIRLAGEHVPGAAAGMAAVFASTGLVTVDARTRIRWVSIPSLPGVSSPQRIEITERGTIEPYSAYNFLSGNRNAVVSGAGPFRFSVGTRGGTAFFCCECNFSATLTFLCPVETVFLNKPPDDYLTRLFFGWGSCTVVFAGESRLQGRVEVVQGAAVTLVADHLGMRGTAGRLGDVDFLFSNATLRYTGAGETTDRTVTLTNNYVGVAGQVALEQAGTGPLTMEGAVKLAPGMAAGTLVLKGASSAASATFAGTLDAGVSLAKTGTGTWVFNPQGGFSGTVSVSGGTLTFDDSLHLASLTAAAGTTCIRVAEGKTLTVDALSVADGKTLDVQLMDATASVCFKNGTAGAPLAHVTLNGHPARLDDAGVLQMVTDGDTVWKTSVSGRWDDAENWVGGALPDSSRTTYIDAVGGDYTVVVAGETVAVTTAVTNLVVNNIGAGTATLRVTNATLAVTGHTTQHSVLRIGAGGRLDVVDAVFRLWDQGNAKGSITSRSSVTLDGGEIAVRGASAFITRGMDESARTDGAEHNLNTYFTFGTGALTFSDDAAFQMERETSKTVIYHAFTPTRAGEAVDVVFRDRARPDLPNLWEFALGGNGGRATVLLDTAWEGVVAGLGCLNYIGRGTGVGEYLVRRGHVKTGTWDLLHIGTPGSDQRTSSTLFATGRVEIAQGASLTAYCRQPIGNGFCGVAVGNAAALTGARGTSFVHGELRVAGTFTQEQSNFLVAEGPNADGDVFHDGGRVSIVDNPALENAKTRGEVVIGAFGGHGRYTLTAGAFTTGHNVYLGGATTNDLFRWHANGDVLQQYHDARGVLTVSGGSFTTAKNLILGRDGTGVVALSGTGVVAAASLVVSNTVGQAASEIRFTVDAARRCGTIDPATRLVFLPGARVVVDVAAEAAKKTPRRVPVWAFDTAPEGLENVTFDLIGAEGIRAPNGLALSDDGRTLAWNVAHGTVLFFR